jgi:hypothetical protein
LSLVEAVVTGVVIASDLGHIHGVRSVDVGGTLRLALIAKDHRANRYRANGLKDRKIHGIVAAVGLLPPIRHPIPKVQSSLLLYVPRYGGQSRW